MTDLHLPVDLGPIVQDQLAAQGLMPPRSNQGGNTTGADDPDDLLPSGEAPMPPLSRDELAQVLAGAERIAPKRPSASGHETTVVVPPPDPMTEYFVGNYAPGVPVFGCPGCAFRARASIDVMWHLDAYPHHAGGDA